MYGHFYCVQRTLFVTQNKIEIIKTLSNLTLGTNSEMPSTNEIYNEYKANITRILKFLGVTFRDKHYNRCKKLHDKNPSYRVVNEVPEYMDEDDTDNEDTKDGVNDEHLQMESDKLQLSFILPGAKLIFDDSDNNICYHGRDCEAKSLQLWEYKDHYVVYEWENEGDDIDVLEFKSVATTCFCCVRDFIERAYTFTPKKDFDYTLFLSRTDKISCVESFFRSLPDGKTQFLEYMKYRYETK
jgi:hypothetical protein